ncbi:photosynthetic NDH subunit of subcomplex B 3, chloroplastic isoform X1 [Hordeum vulgare subsp. vulgare]|uniref:photosynthetic NDH subunit of subcomplex B 3, chloroplastic isoform X1 n=1 Tax=Hordeum vulgare subsp. vulgare TaxID=112509 RepID=UPI001D1A383D|nr:photosynthetic NDH subunit of subcomplex B 3, chloroplastic isoform X1 [Hordeum vulgare subsp. vulgare]
MAATLQFVSLLGTTSAHPAPSSCSSSSSSSEKHHRSVHLPQQRQPSRRRRLRAVRAVETDAPAAAADSEATVEPPSVDFAFVSPRLLPDGTPDVHYRTACGGQKLRDIMLDGYIDLYGPYDKLLLNCSGGGECGTCIVECNTETSENISSRLTFFQVVEGGEMLSPKNEVEKEKLKRKPKSWRLACQATVGNPDSTGQMVIQQLPEWKVHKWDK